MPQPSKRKRGFQRSLCKQGAGIAWETITMVMIEGLEKQLGLPEKKLPVLKVLSPAHGQVPTSHIPAPAQRCLAASPCPLLTRTMMDVQPQQTMTRHCIPTKKGTATLLSPLRAPQPSQAQAAVPCETQGWAAPPMAGPTFQSVSTVERKTSEFSWDEKEPLGTETPLTFAAPSHPAHKAPRHHRHSLPEAAGDTGDTELTRVHTHIHLHSSCTQVHVLPACVHTHRCMLA